jgi:LacI family transcriptional regulator
MNASSFPISNPKIAAPKSALQKASVGIRELARQLDLSIGTVSRGLNNRSGVNPSTRKRVLEHARRIGYVPNGAARSLKDHTTLNIGLLFAPFLGVNNEINPVALQFIDLFREQTAAENMALNVILFTNEGELKGQITSNHLDMVVFYGEFPASSFGIVSELGIPAIVLHYKSEFANQISILVNTVEAGSRAVEYLAALGHQRIGLVTGPRSTIHAEGIAKGFFKGIGEFKLELYEEWVAELTPATSNKDGAAAVLQPILSRPHRPTAIAFSSDWLALGGYKVARDLGLRVPEDLSIIGFDNVPVTSELTPPLTTFDINTPKLAKMLADLCKDLGSRRWDVGSYALRDVFLTPDLVKRDSCVCVRSSNRS